MYDMVLANKPDLKIVDKNKLRISRSPSLISWILLTLSVVAFYQIFRRITDNVFFTAVSLMGEIMFGLDTLGEWEDLVLDRDADLAIFTRSNWSEKLLSPNANNATMRLSEIRHVGVSANNGLFMICRDGKIVELDVQGLTRDDVQNHRKEINYFLNMNKMARLDERGLDPYERVFATSDSDEESTGYHQKRNLSNNHRGSTYQLPQNDEAALENYFLKNHLSARSFEPSALKSREIQPRRSNRGRVFRKKVSE